MYQDNRIGNVFVKVCFAALLGCAALAGLATKAQAEADSFGLGTGRDGALSVTTANTTINVYASITANAAASATTISVDSTTGFAAGQLVMLWQTTGLTTMQAPRGTQTTIDLSSSGVGHYEFARIESVNAMGNTLVLTLPIVDAYALGKAQLIRVPEYTTVTLSGAGTIVPAQTWNGSKGGVVTFFATGAVTNGGVIAADAAGFRGGALVNHASLNNCNAATMGLPDDSTPALGYSPKGEGLVPGAFSAAAGGRTNVANGGGGGVCHNSGGGGGAHAGRGGDGGKTWAGDGGGRLLGGYGGAALSYDPKLQMSFGGGGGSGDENNNVGTPGGVGGGVVLIRAASMAGAGFIRANGSKPTNNGNPAANDASGGGGAGGAVILRIVGALACMAVEAQGGAGGDVRTGATAAADAHGIGGGGGGGRVYIESGTAACSTNADAGLAGLWTSVNGLNSDSWGAKPSTVTDMLSVGLVSIVGSAFVPATCTAATLAAGLCGGCILNSECLGGSAPVCSLSTNSCVACSANFGGGAGACTNASTPVCVTAGASSGACGECNNDADCGANMNGPVCDTTKGRCGTCSAANAMACTGATAFCNTSPTHSVCAGCNGDQGSAFSRACSNALPACVSSGGSAGTCVECLANSQCVGNGNGAVCDGFKRLCGACNTSELSACTGSTPTCNISGMRDVCTACNGNFASGAAQACTVAGVPMCALTGALAGGCLQCLSSVDCNGNTPICDTSVGSCVSCNGDFASGAARTCGLAQPFCAASGCSNVCTMDVQCGAGNWCNSGACQPKLPNGQTSPGGSCQPALAARACQSGVCDVTDGLCGLPTGNPQCTTTTQCRSGVCVASGANTGVCLACNTDNDCAGNSGNPACNPVTNLCVACTAGNTTACVGILPLCDIGTSSCVACNGDAGSTATRACGAGSPLCRVDGSCGACTANADCSVGTHLGTICNSSSGACGTGCSVDANCSATQYCDNPGGSGFNGSCTPKLANNTVYPAGQPFGGMCNATTATRVCQSGVCDEPDDKCGLPNGGTCANAAVCRSAVCGVGGLCGLPNNEACMNNNVCRSDTCSSDGLCGLPNSVACVNASQCRSSVCGEGNKCGRPNGETCDANTVCRTGVCFADGKCGVPSGQTCANAAACRSQDCKDTVCQNTPDAGAGDDAGINVDGGIADGGGAGNDGSAGGGNAGNAGNVGTGGSAGVAGNAGGDTGGAAGNDELRVGGGGFSCQFGQSSPPVGFVWGLGVVLWLRRRRRRN